MFVKRSLHLSVLLAANAKHRVTVSGAHDVAGNFMLSSAKTIFTTGTR